MSILRHVSPPDRADRVELQQPASRAATGTRWLQCRAQKRQRPRGSHAGVAL